MPNNTTSAIIDAAVRKLNILSADIENSAVRYATMTASGYVVRLRAARRSFLRRPSASTWQWMQAAAVQLSGASTELSRVLRDYSQSSELGGRDYSTCRLVIINAWSVLPEVEDEVPYAFSATGRPYRSMVEIAEVAARRASA
jgi:hypothetical protein